MTTYRFYFASLDAVLVPPVEEQPPTVTPLTTSTTQPVTYIKLLDTTTKPTPPQPEDGCTLSYDPYYASGHPEEGYRFGKNYVILFKISYDSINPIDCIIVLVAPQQEHETTVTLRTLNYLVGKRTVSTYQYPFALLTSKAVSFFTPLPT